MREVLRRAWSARRAILFYAALLAAGWWLGELFRSYVIPEKIPMDGPMMRRIIMLLMIAFVVTAALPFVPAAEIGFALLFMFGANVALLVYAGMVGALILSYCVARFVALKTLADGFAWLGLGRAAGFISELAEVRPVQRAELVATKLTGSRGETLLRGRYVLLALAINVPGNSLIGGGGGLAFMAGCSGLYPFWAFVLTIMLAVAPVPLFFWIAD